MDRRHVFQQARERLQAPKRSKKKVLCAGKPASVILFFFLRDAGVKLVYPKSGKKEGKVTEEKKGAVVLGCRGRALQDRHI